MKKSWLHRLAAVTALGIGAASAGGALAQDQITLNWALWDWSATAYYQPLIDAYQAANPNVKIEYTDLGSTDYQTVLQTQLAGGSDDFDIITIKDIPGYTNLVGANLLTPLNEYIASAGIDTAAYGGVVEALTLDGKVYGLPFRSDFWLLYYNKDLFDKAGVAYPTNDLTLAQFDELARQVTSGFGADKVYGTHFHTWRSTVQLPGILDGQHTLIDGTYDFLQAALRARPCPAERRRDPVLRRAQDIEHALFRAVLQRTDRDAADGKLVHRHPDRQGEVW